MDPPPGLRHPDRWRVRSAVADLVNTTGERDAFWTLIALGVLMALAALVSLGMPGVVATEAPTMLFGVLLFVAPWVVGAIAIVLSGSAIPASNRPTTRRSSTKPQVPHRTGPAGIGRSRPATRLRPRA